MIPRRAAFTLIELLVVISIIAILAAMLLPAIGMVKAQAQQARCASSQRQLAMGIQAYSADWDGLLPRLKTPLAEDMTIARHWFNSIATYVGHEQEDGASIFAARGSSVIWGCQAWRPSMLTTSKTGYGMTWFPDSPNSSKSSMSWLDPSGGIDPAGVDFSVSRIRQPSRRIVIGDAADWHLFFTYGSPGYFAGAWDQDRHRGKAVYTFFDGHVQPVPSAASAWLGCSNPASAAWNP